MLKERIDLIKSRDEKSFLWIFFIFYFYLYWREFFYKNVFAFRWSIVVFHITSAYLVALFTDRMIMVIDYCSNEKHKNLLLSFFIRSESKKWSNWNFKNVALCHLDILYTTEYKFFFAFTWKFEFLSIAEKNSITSWTTWSSVKFGYTIHWKKNNILKKNKILWQILFFIISWIKKFI